MFTEILFAITFGMASGTFTGLIPGVHVNLVSLLCVSIAPFLMQYLDPITICIFIVAMAITHTFIDSIPSIFLGAPDSDMAMGVLPGHRLLLQGKGYDAVTLTIIGSLLCLILTSLLIPLMIPFAPLIYNTIKPYIGYILLFVVIFMILDEKTLKKKFFALTIFSLSGLLGIAVLSSYTFKQPLLPMLSGLFGISTLLLSLKDNVNIPRQKCVNTVSIPKKNTIKALLAGTFSGSLTGLFPGLGSAQASIIGMQIVGNIGEHAFMILVGGINTVNFLFSLVTFYTLQKARNGAIVAVQKIIESITIQQMLFLLFSALITGGVATWLAFKLAKIFSLLILKVNYKKLVIAIILLIISMTLLFSGLSGIIILVTSTSIGILAPILNVKRSHAMGCLLMSVIIFFLG